MSKILFFGLKNWAVHRYWECCLAKHLELNEHEVKYYSYNKMFGGDDLNSHRKYEHIHKHIASKTGEQIPGMFRLNTVVPVEDYFTQVDLQNAEAILGLSEQRELESLEYKGINLGAACRISTVRQSHTIDRASKEYQDFFVENVSTSIYMIDAFERILTDEKPDVVFVMNGIMFLENIIIQLCKRLGIRVVSYERAARPDHLYITANGPVNDFMFDNRFDINKELSDIELKEIKEYLHDRRTSKNTTQKFQDSDTDDLEKTKKAVNFESIKDKEIISLFTNVMWDTAAVDRDTIFKDVLDWCIKTIEWAKNQEDVELFIRIHPADARYWNFSGAKQLQDEILKHYIDKDEKYSKESLDSTSFLPSNVHLIKSTTKLNSYCLAELSDVVSTYTSQIGVELAAMGKPVIVAGDAFYGKQGIGIMPKDQDDYFDYLECGVDCIDFVNKDEALRFAHFLYFKMHYPFRLITEDASKGMGVVTDFGFIKDLEDGRRIIDFDVIKNDVDLQNISSYLLEGIKGEFDDLQIAEVKV